MSLDPTHKQPALSHTYQLAGNDWLWIVLPPLGILGLFSIFLRLGAATHLLPPPQPDLDADRTILLHQAQASRSKHRADIVLIGDSSCMMDVSVRQLGTYLPTGHIALNLGTLSYLDLKSYGSLLAQFTDVNPGTLRTVILLMNPEALRRPSATDYHTQALRHFFAAKDYCGPTLTSTLCLLGVETFRGRILSRLLPQPLPGQLGATYGFTRDLWDYLSENGGSALDPSQFDIRHAQGNAEYRLAKSLEAASRAFRRALPPGTRLLVGITPVPEQFATPGHAQLHRQLLATWSQWLEGEPLEELPATMPSPFFASTTHLNASGTEAYTSQLGKALAARLTRTP